MFGCTQNNSTPQLSDLAGNKINLADYHGKWVIINYWASWCKPCFKEIPQINKFYNAHKDDVVVLGVSYDQASGKDLQQIVKKMDIQFPTLNQDPRKQFGIDQIKGLPVTFVVGPDGKLKKTLYGEQTQRSLEVATQMNQPKFAVA